MVMDDVIVEEQKERIPGEIGEIRSWLARRLRAEGVPTHYWRVIGAAYEYGMEGSSEVQNAARQIQDLQRAADGLFNYIETTE
jgi:hypothetical protein